uniref:60S ribosomal export protein NMD3 n=1 Tax=Xiphophorus couchianus TaxID=32473 RepID=A0A3B5LXA5_9TELE
MTTKSPEGQKREVSGSFKVCFLLRSLCCTCGVPIPPNPANMCVACLRTQVDISEGIPKQVTVHFCKQCERYLQPPATWMQCALESRELLALCLKKLKSSMTKVGRIIIFLQFKRLKVQESHGFSPRLVLLRMKCLINSKRRDFNAELSSLKKKLISSTLVSPVAEVDGNTYWRNPFNSLCSPRQLEEFIVMDADVIRDQKLGAGAGTRSNKHTLAEVWVQKTSEMDSSQQYHCRTFLGHLLNIGDLVMGYDFANSNINDEYLNKMNPHHLPDVVLIKKSYDRSRRVKRRNWKLQEMARDREGMDTDDERQYQDFLEDLEEDEALRKNVNIYRDASKIPVESDTDDDGAPRISLMEMMEELSLADATGGEGADMMTD